MQRDRRKTMLKVIAENENGEKLEITNETRYKTTITGLNPVNAVVNTTAIGEYDGTILNSTRLENRNIVITTIPQGKIEENRLSLYRIFRTKKKVTLYISGNREVYTEGVVESFQLDHGENPQKAQISILCTNPKLQAMEEKEENSVEISNLFEFPFSIQEEGIEFSTLEIKEVIAVENEGEIETGMILEFYASGGKVKNPVVYSVKTHGSIGFLCEMEENQRIRVNTTRGEKEVTSTFEGKQTNFFGQLIKPAEWFQVEQGENLYTVSAEEGLENLNVTFKTRTAYQGV